MRLALAALLGVAVGALLAAAVQAVRDAGFMARLERAAEACERYGMVLALEAGAEPECVRRR